MSEEQTNDKPVVGESEGKPVFPSEYEIVMNILDQYQKQLDEHTAKTTEAIEKLKKNLRTAEDSSMAILAQKKLIETLTRDLKKVTGR